MEGQEPGVLSIAGLDPSGGAGLLADCKTFEHCGVKGFGVCTALTYQSASFFDGVSWASSERIKRQLTVLLREHEIGCVKIGLIESLEVLAATLDILATLAPRVKIVWDPVMRATAGFTFHEKLDQRLLEEVLTRIDLITPNEQEVEFLIEANDWAEACQLLARMATVCVTGVRVDLETVMDVVLIGEAEHRLSQAIVRNRAKHGSGCVFSSALSASLARKSDVVRAVKEAQSVTRKLLLSSESMLGNFTPYSRIASGGKSSILA